MKIKFHKSIRKIEVLLLFFFMFDILLLGVPSIFSSRKIVFLVYLFSFIIRKNQVYYEELNKIKCYGIICSFITMYVILISCLQGSIQNDSNIISRMIYFLVYAVIGSFLVICRYDNEYEFMENIIKCMLIQSIIVFFEFFSYPFKVFLSRTFISTGNVDYMRLDRATGLGAEAAYLTLLIYLGVFCCCYIIYNKQFEMKHAISIIIFFGAMFVVGRTGLYVSCLTLFVTTFLLIIRREKIKTFVNCLLFMIPSVIVGWTLITKYMTVEQLNRFAGRIISAIFNFSNDDSVMRFNSDIIPPLTIDTFIGTGVYRGKTQNVYIYADGGYFQAYAAMGILVAVIFYLIYFLFLKKLISQTKQKCETGEKIYFYLLFVILAIVEYKEPFVLKYMLTTFYVVAVCLSHKRRKENEEKNKRSCTCI